MHEVAAQVDTGAQDKQLQLNLLGSSDAVFQQRNRDIAIAEGRLTKLEHELQEAKFQLLQFESTVARLRTESSGYEVDQKTSAHRHDAIAGDLEEVRRQQAAAAQAAAEQAARVEAALAEKSRVHEAAAAAQQALADLTREFREAQRRLQEIDRQLAQRSARLKLLQQLQERWEGFGEGAKAVLQGRLTPALAGQKATPLMQGLEVEARVWPGLRGPARVRHRGDRCRRPGDRAAGADPARTGADRFRGPADLGFERGARRERRHPSSRARARDHRPHPCRRGPSRAGAARRLLHRR